MLDGSLKKAMQAEHCDKGDSTAPFSTSNGMDNVTSRAEWEFVTKPREVVEYTERGCEFQERHPGWRRKKTPFGEYQAKMEAKNMELLARGHTQMVD